MKNISQNGMYIETKEPLPFHLKFDSYMPLKSKLKILIDFDNDVLEIPVRVKRLIRNNASTGMGVMLLNPPPHTYMDFMSDIVTVN